MYENQKRCQERIIKNLQEVKMAGFIGVLSCRRRIWQDVLVALDQNSLWLAACQNKESYLFFKPLTKKT